MAFLFATARELRVLQWIKNLGVFAAITFSGQLFSRELLSVTTLAFVAFCLVSSAGYIINDLFDLRHDQAHPVKRYRPLAAGVVSKRFSIILLIALILVAFFIASGITQGFLIICIFYLLLQFTYSMILKNIAVVDILAIATGYFLRVLAGEAATGFHVSAWLLLSAISLSLFLAVGKRRVEFALVRARRSLTHYTEKLLDEYLSVFATATFLSYSLFTFLGDPEGSRVFFFERKWLMGTIPFVVFGLMRYMQDLYEKDLGERPEKVLFADKLLLLNIVGWGASVILILYFLPAA